MMVILKGTALMRIDISLLETGRHHLRQHWLCPYAQEIQPHTHDIIVSVKSILPCTIKCLSIGTPKTINFPFVPNGKLMVLDVPIF